ncbi:MAG: WD40 repeat domain-containing protein [Cyanobacteria bacterium P01_D01_bin.36]
MPKQLATQLSTHTVNLGSGKDQFEVTVSNLSDRFATFALDLSASGLDRQASSDWYRLTPDLSAKIPAGDQVNFIVNILEVPPIPGGFTGKMNVNVNVTCLELGEADRQLVNLVVAGSGSLPAQLKMPEDELQTLPGAVIEIPLQVHNPNLNTAHLRASIKGLPHPWLNGHERRLQVTPKGTANLLFVCQPPFSSEAGVYPFTIEVGQREAAAATLSSRLEILPTGNVIFSCRVNELESKPDSSGDFSDKSTFEEAVDHKNKPEGDPDSQAAKAKTKDVVRYTAELNNDSNVAQQVALSLNRIDIPWYEQVRSRFQRRLPEPAVTTKHLLQLSPAEATLGAGDRAELTLTTQPKRHWLGWRQRQYFQLQTQQQSTPVIPSTQTIEIVADPKVPLWVQAIGLGVISLLLLTFAYFKDGHRAPVNSVQFDGQANSLISASDDHTIHRWQTARRLRDFATLSNIDKAVRVVHYRPRQNNLLAAGLENGEIQIWDFLSQRAPVSLISDRADRVFDLQFSHDSDSLFSIHGSGQILKWDTNDLTKIATASAASEKRFDFAAQAMALVGSEHHLLAIGGRFNRLVLWDFEKDTQQVLNYPGEVDPNHYLFDVTAAEDRPMRFAAADNQGRITLWNLDTCSINNTSDGNSDTGCRPSDQWQDGHGGQAVNAVALSKDACYLASGGDDGKVVLWSLNGAGQVLKKKVLFRSSKPINSVDIVRQDNTLIIASGGDDHRVRLKRTSTKNRSNNERCL